MNSGIIIVLPMLFFFLLDFFVLVNMYTYRDQSRQYRVFELYAICSLLLQGAATVTYGCNYGVIELNRTVLYLFQYLSLISMSAASFFWYRYVVVITCNDRYPRVLSALAWIPVTGITIAVLLSPLTHWVFSFDANNVYVKGPGYSVHAACCWIYLAFCFIAAHLDYQQMRRVRKKTIFALLLFIIPHLIGTVIQMLVFRGGYSQMAASISFVLLYLEQFVESANEAKRLKGVEVLNKSLTEQMDIIGGLTNAFLGCYAVDVDTRTFITVKEVEFVHEAVNGCRTMDEAFERYIPVGVHQDDREMMKTFTDASTLSERLASANAVTTEYRGVLFESEWYRASWIVAKRDENGRVYGVLFVVEEITGLVLERKKIQDELQKARDEADRANRAKTDFLFSMSHDIRTPMNAIIGYAALMEKHAEDRERCDDYLSKIQNSSDYLLDLINDVLEMARIESGKIAIDEEVGYIGDVTSEILTVYSEMMRQKNIEFEVRCDVQNEYFYYDKVKIREIFMNLLSNAYKYTPEGGCVSVKIEQLPDERLGYLRIRSTVSDTGIGMSKEYLPKLFEEFSREQTFTQNKIQGTGLGMPIVKRLIDLMGGTIEVESELGKGSTFVVTIPHRIAAEADTSDEISVDVDPDMFFGKRVLLAEDNLLNTEIAMEILGEYGLRVEHAADGIICVDMVARAEAGYYDLILMDIQMPNLDGYGATRRIRAMSDPEKASIPIVAMTANAFDEDKKNAFAAGMNGHLSKPIEIARLTEMLAEFLDV